MLARLIVERNCARKWNGNGLNGGRGSEQMSMMAMSFFINCFMFKSGVVSFLPHYLSKRSKMGALLVITKAMKVLSISTPFSRFITL